MIEFRGELSDECKQQLLKVLYRTSRFSALIVFIIMGVPFPFIGIITSSWISGVIAAFIGLVSILLTIPITNPQTRTLTLNIPTKVTIKNGKLEKEGYGEGNYAIRQIEDIKKVIDMGEWYHIIFYFGYKDGFFICQKNLIVKGTIEEFENLFQDKIVRTKGKKITC